MAVEAGRPSSDISLITFTIQFGHERAWKFPQKLAFPSLHIAVGGLPPTKQLLTIIRMGKDVFGAAS
jgi:hypothetical protein